MKGFPNQVADLEKIATAMRTLMQLADAGRNPRDDGVYGPELVRAGVAGTGHTPRPVEAYIREQLRKDASRQSFRTTARGLRELFRLLGFIDDTGGRVQVLDLGRQAAGFASAPLDDMQKQFWRRVIRNMTHTGSHPYQVLLRLVAQKPGITRAKCALALEARDDSPGELDRIVHLVDLTEEQICRQIDVSESNWDNAKKVLPKFAEQLGDVIRTGHTYVLAAAPGGAAAGAAEPGREQAPARREPREARPRAPRGSRQVTPETIGRAGTAERFDEVEIPPNIDPAAAREAVRQRLDRLRRHNLIVQALASRLGDAGAELFEDPFDVLAMLDDVGILGEVKTLDGSAADERDRVQEALAQLLYYEAFVAAPLVGEAAIHKIACFEAPITMEHQDWLDASGIATIWSLGEGRFGGNGSARRVLSGYLEELR